MKVSHGVKFEFVFFEFGFTLIKSGVYGVSVGFLREKKFIIHCVALFIMKRFELKLLIGDLLGYFLDRIKRWVRFELRERKVVIKWHEGEFRVLMLLLGLGVGTQFIEAKSIRGIGLGEGTFF